MIFASSLFVYIISLHLQLSSCFFTPIPHNTPTNYLTLNALGADALERPEDENSPEFREYLKQLLGLQANRAKTGYAAPSSGSSDAYFAKLNRLKLEQIARRRAGLPDVKLDTSYRPEDYQAAIYEAQEPLVSSGVIPAGGSAGPSKVRILSEEEIKMSQLAEEKVRRALNEERNKNAIPTTATVMDASPLPASSLVEKITPKDSVISNKKLLVPKTSKEDAKVIEDIVSRLAPAGKKPPTRFTEQLASSSQSMIGMASDGVKKMEEVSREDQALVMKAEGRPIKSVKSPATLAIQSSPPRESPSGSTAASGGKVVMKRKLEKDEVEVAGKALELLVKHRGGGPFGLGRLSEETDLRSLCNALNDLNHLMERDSTLAVAEKPRKDPSETSSESMVLPDLAELKPSRVRPNEPITISSDRLKQPVEEEIEEDVEVLVRAKREEERGQVEVTVSRMKSQKVSLPIATLMEAFSETSDQMSVEDIGALRDGVIRFLNDIVSTLERRSASSNPKRVSAGKSLGSSLPFTAQTRAVAEEDEEVQGRGKDLQDTSLLDSGAERELKTTLGLLLKHRGGPGFGHGRLQGKELQMLENKLRSTVDLLSEETTRQATKV